MKPHPPPTLVALYASKHGSEYLARMARIVASLAMRRFARHINPRRQGGYP
jgi:hypothetical protein